MCFLVAQKRKMKKTIITVSITMVLTALVVLTIFEVLAQMDQAEADEIEEIESEILGEKRKLLIHLPTTYDSLKRYPVLYVLDGSSQDFRMAAIAEVLNRAGVVEEMIIVGIPNTNRNRDLTPHYILQDTDGNTYGEGDRFLQFLTQEAEPYIRARYPVTNYRMLAGHSRAGLFSFYAGLEKPGFYDALFCFSPAFWRDEAIIVDNAATAWKRAAPLDTFLFMSLGTEENDKMTSAYQQMTHLMDQYLGDNGIHQLTEGANHGNNLYFSTPFALTKWGESRNVTR